MIRILHISDLHIAEHAAVWGILDRAKSFDVSYGTFLRMDRGIAQVSSYSREKLAAVANLLTKIEKDIGPINAVLATGDLSTTGRKEDLKTALRFFEEKPGGLSSTLTAGGFPTLAGNSGLLSFILLPGNHDRYQAGLSGTYAPGGRQFDRVFYEYWSGIVQSHLVKGSSEELEVGVVCADLTLDSSFDTNGTDLFSRKINSFAQGRARRITIDIMTKKTEELITGIKSRDKKAMILWAMHFPPHYPGATSTHKLIGEDFLVNQARHLKVEAILCGHNHKYSAYPVGDEFILCNGTSSQDSAPDGNFCQLLEMDCPAGGVPTFNFAKYYYDQASGGFQLDDTQ